MAVETSLRPVSVAVIAAPPVRRHCRAILTRAGEPPVASRGVHPASAARLLRTYRPAAILLDALTSPLRALFVLPALKQLSPASSIILIGGDSTPIKFILAALRRGASGHIAARDLSRDLPKALRTVAAGEPWLSRRLGAAIVAEIRTASCPDSHHNAATPDTGQGRARH
jgi:DNA-binding NarL/FixJ family response regulator